MNKAWMQPPDRERDEAIVLANAILDRPNADPDDDLAVLARQLLRALERLGAYDQPEVSPMFRRLRT
jgi:hypothetical protein